MKQKACGTRRTSSSSARCWTQGDTSPASCCTRSRTRAQARTTAASRSWPRSTTWPRWGRSRRLVLLQLALALRPVVEAVPEPLDLRRYDREIGLLGLALCLARHVRDHLGQDIKELLLEHHQMPVDPNPVAGVLQRLRLWILSKYQPLDVSAFPSRPSSLLSPGGHVHILGSLWRYVTSFLAGRHRGGLYYQTRSGL